MMVHRWETKMNMLGTQVKSCMELLKGLTMEGFLKELMEECRSTQMNLVAEIKGSYKRGRFQKARDTFSERNSSQDFYWQSDKEISNEISTETKNEHKMRTQLETEKGTKK